MLRSGEVTEFLAPLTGHGGEPRTRTRTGNMCANVTRDTPIP
jgi:hypothetical protein